MPDTQILQTLLLLDPESWLYVPPGHDVHDDALLLTPYEPAGHGVQVLLPALLKVPEEQALHVDAVVAPVALDDVPAGHPGHETARVTDE